MAVREEVAARRARIHRGQQDEQQDLNYCGGGGNAYDEYAAAMAVPAGRCHLGIDLPIVDQHLDTRGSPCCTVLNLACPVCFDGFQYVPLHRRSVHRATSGCGEGVLARTYTGVPLETGVDLSSSPSCCSPVCCPFLRDRNGIHQKLRRIRTDAAVPEACEEQPRNLDDAEAVVDDDHGR
eukprot:2783090-Prymnesium_polylepis.1